MENKSEIEVYEYHEHIRLRTGMYIGGVDDRGILALIKGLTDDITGRVSSTVSIKYTILDNYNIELLISSLQSDVIHTSFIATDYFNQNIYPLSAKALCSSFSVSYRGQQQKFEKGVKVSSEACSNSDVLNIKLAIDKSIFSNIDLDYYLLCRTLYYVAILNPLSRIEIEDKREGHNNLLALNFPLGIKSHFRRLCTVAYSAAKKEIIIERTVGSNQYEICIGWGDIIYDDIKHQTYCNNEHLKWGGSLIDGIKLGLISAGKNNLKGSCKVNPKLSAITIVSVLKTPEPNWYGSTKTALGMPQVKREVKKLVAEAVQQHLVENLGSEEKLLYNMCRY